MTLPLGYALLLAAALGVLSPFVRRDRSGLIDAAALARFKPSAWLVNTARGGCVDEPALIAALKAGTLAGAALDTVAEEPLPASSPLWGLPNVIVTPHTAGETRRYETNVAQILQANLDRLWAGDDTLINGIV